MADACPDTCCEGWRVGIDKQTYRKYDQSSDPVLKPKFQQLITINPVRTSDDQYAVFSTSGGRCTFLSEGLCSIQQRLGETYLGAACASFPRVSNLVDGVVERSLDLSCPEAARLGLLNPEPLQFLLEAPPVDHYSPVAAPQYGSLASRNENVAPVRRLTLALLQNRKFPVSQRLILLGHVCDDVCDGGATPTVLEGSACPTGCKPNPATQLGIILELVVERLNSDFTHRHFLELYQQFLNGIRWTPDLSLESAGDHYSRAYLQHYLPLISQHEYILEHYLVNNAFKTLFPFGSQSLNRALNLEPHRAITGQYILLTSYYSIVKAMLIGVAGFYGTAFNLDTVIRTIQVCSKTFEHSISYPKRILEILASNGIVNAAGMTVLTQN